MEPSSTPSSSSTEFFEWLVQAIENDEQGQQHQQQQHEQQHQQQSLAAGNTQQHHQMNNLVRDTYVQLCHDDPVGITSAGLRALANNLVVAEKSNYHNKKNTNSPQDEPQQQGPLALSPRLLEGLRQILQRYNHSHSYQNSNQQLEQQQLLSMSSSMTDVLDSTITNRPNVDQSNTTSSIGTITGTTTQESLFISSSTQEQVSFDSNSSSTTITSTSSSLASSVAVMAWTCWGRIPLLVFLAEKNLSLAAAPLGSYRKHKQQQQQQPELLLDHKSTSDDEQQQQQQSPEPLYDPNRIRSSSSRSSSSTNDNTIPNHNHQEQNNQNSSTTTDLIPVVGTKMDHDEVVAIEDQQQQEVEEEIWATESDHSDYVYESDWDYQKQMQEIHLWATTSCEMDPIQLSQCPTSNHETNWLSLTNTIASLLMEMTFTKISSLSIMDWQQYKISDHLTQLIMILFIPTISKSPMLYGPFYPIEFWQHLGLQLLHVFRDATLSHIDNSTGHNTSSDNNNNNRNNNNSNNIVMLGYIRLLQTLLQVNVAQDKNNSIQHISSSKQQASIVPPASWAGLSCLSALCSTILTQADGGQRMKYSKYLGVLQSAILHVCDDIALLLETSSSTTDHTPSLVYWTYVPLFRVLTSTTVSSGSSSSSTYNTTLSATNCAQTLLNSGLFRKWISLWVESLQNHSNILIGLPWGEIVFELCVMSPTVLGKYAWRFPGLANQATVMTSTSVPGNDNNNNNTSINERGSDHLLDSILWNLLGIHLAEGEAVAENKIRWKNNHTTAAMMSPPTKEKCQQFARLTIRTLIHKVTNVLTAWKRRLESTLENVIQVQDNEVRRQHQQEFQVLSDFGTLVKYLSIPLIRRLFLVHNVVGDLTEHGQQQQQSLNQNCLQAYLDEIREALSEWPTIPSAAEVSSSPRRASHQHVSDDEHADNDDVDDFDDDKEWTKVSPLLQGSQRDRLHAAETTTALNELRKHIKVLQSVLDENAFQKLNGSSAKSGSTIVDEAAISTHSLVFSSKAD